MPVELIITSIATPFFFSCFAFFSAFLFQGFFPDALDFDIGGDPFGALTKFFQKTVVFKGIIVLFRDDCNTGIIKKNSAAKEKN